MTSTIDSEQFHSLMHITSRPDAIMVRGEGSYMWDARGRRYLDFLQGWAVNTLGHCAPQMRAALRDQAATLIHPAAAYHNAPQLRLAAALTAASDLDRVFFGNSGAEANEGAIKLARKYGRDNRNGAVEIITAIDSFHGRTTGALAATGNANYQANFLPLMTGFVHVPFGDIDAIKAATNEGTCAVMLEPVQGEGGVISPPDGYLKAVRQWCDEQRILLILDEIQTGVGRLGTMWGYEQFDIEPDVMTIAKAMGGGVPIGAFLCKDACDVLRPGDHGSTYGGNALTCAASYAVLNHVKEEGLVEHGRLMGERLKGKLEEARTRQVTLMARHRAAEARKKLAQSIHGLGDDAFSSFERFEQRVEESEAEAEAHTEVASELDDVERRVRDLDRSASVEEELRALKERLLSERDASKGKGK